ncbi:MAG TPA: helix-turn-helix transcriptional regulator [Candidatus Acidoferrales bacterium]|jgi:transcriptional regulator with XRE-family HTH domain|nr:helix-turn-helix transcriptional regulator [Candidatus Acidoferrales bacterium]
MELGKAIKLVRTASGRRQGEVAESLGVTSNYLSLVENGKREPSVSFLKRLGATLGVPVGFFFLWEGSETTTSKNMDQLRDLLAQLEAMYVFAKRGKNPGKRTSA